MVSVPLESLLFRTHELEVFLLYNNGWHVKYPEETWQVSDAGIIWYIDERLFFRTWTPHNRSVLPGVPSLPRFTTTCGKGSPKPPNQTEGLGMGFEPPKRDVVGPDMSPVEAPDGTTPDVLSKLWELAPPENCEEELTAQTLCSQALVPLV